MNPPKTTRRERILVYDFHISGHCPGWLSLVASSLASNADLLLCCQSDHPEVSPWIRKLEPLGARIEVRPCNAAQPAHHAASVARSEGIRRIFFPNFDSVIYSIGKRGAPGVFEGLSIGGIWLRPELAAPPTCGLPEILLRFDRSRRGKRRRQHLRAVSNNRKGLADILLEEHAVDELHLFFTSGESLLEAKPFINQHEPQRICDPWLTRHETPRADARKQLGIDQDVVVFLHAGTSRPEKGLKDSCEAMLRLDDATLHRSCLLRAGKVDPGDAAILNSLSLRGVASFMDRYVSEEEMMLCYAACDWVLLPYRNQKESSGILIHAAANERPVIASEFGLIGTNTLKHGLGLTFPHRDVDALSKLLEKVINSGGRMLLENTNGMKNFAAINSPSEFRKTLLQKWLPNNGP